MGCDSGGDPVGRGRDPRRDHRDTLGAGVPAPRRDPDGAYLWLFVIAIAVGLLASLAGLRRAVKVEPALAFGGP